MPAYALALATTLLLEVPVVAAAYRALAPARRSVAAALAVNLATHGLLWLAWPSLPGGHAARLAASELVVAAAEAAAYGALLGGTRARALAASAAANALSTGAGLALWALRG